MISINCPGITVGLHLSEIVSDLIEPMVGRIKGGREVISGEDLLARVDRVNVENEGWKPDSWWKGKSSGNFEACELCVGNSNYVWDEENPELCTCQEGKRTNNIQGGGITGQTSMKMNSEVEKSISPENIVEELPTSPKVDSEAVKTTVNFVRTRRRLVWEQMMDWEDEDVDRKVDSTEVLQEDLQD